MIYRLSHSFDIQLFAGNESEAEGIAGDKERAFDAGKPVTGGNNSPDAGEKGAQDRAGKFEALIKGEYKDLYDAHVQHIVKQRLKGSEETIRKYRALSPGLQLLEKKYGVPAGDAQALSDALLREQEQRTQRAETLAQRQYEKWVEEARQAQMNYPGLDISRELSQPRFASLIKSGVSVSDAYGLVHREELMESTLRELEDKISRRILSGANRPRESGMGAGSSAVVKNDVSKMSKSTRQEIIRRVRQGEKISF